MDKASLRKNDEDSSSNAIDVEDPKGGISNTEEQHDSQQRNVLDSQQSTMDTTTESTETTSTKRNKKQQSVRFPTILTENYSEPTFTDREKTLRARKVFKWLPVRCQNDLLHGSWWFVAASILASIIPVFPLINVYLNKNRFWPINFANYLAIETQAIVYSILIACGIMFTLGSLLLLRVFSIPKQPSMISSSSFLHNLFPSDEVTASWLFFLGTAPTVAVTVLYSYYLPEYTLMVYQVAIIFCVLATFIVLGFTCAIYPQEESSSSTGRQYLAPLARCFVCHHRRLLHHIANDWLVLCWLFLIGSIFCSIGCIAALVGMNYPYKPFLQLQLLTQPH